MVVNVPWPRRDNVFVIAICLSCLRLKMLSTIVLVAAAFVNAAVVPAPTFASVAVRQDAPAPTAAQSLVLKALKRQAPTSICGYVEGNTGQTFLQEVVHLLTLTDAASPFTCGANNFCGFNSAYGAFGCCTAAVGGTLEGCNYHTTCLDSTAFALCGAACQTDTLVAWW